MKLLDLVKDLDFECVQGSTDIDVTTLVYDSRKVEQGSVFVCISGAVRDGHDFAEDVVKSGAKALIVEKDVEASGDVTVISCIFWQSCKRAYNHWDYRDKGKDNFDIYGSFDIRGIRY